MKDFRHSRGTGPRLPDRDDRIQQLERALKKLAFAARTSGGTAGRDEALCAACDAAEALLKDRP